MDYVLWLNAFPAAGELEIDTFYHLFFKVALSNIMILLL